MSTRPFRSLFTLVLLMPFVGYSTGCVPRLVGGLIGNAVTVSADYTSVKPELRAMLSSAQRIGLLTAENSPSAIATAEYLDQHGGYRVTIEASALKGWTPAQKRDAMTELCKEGEKFDIVAAAMSSTNDLGAGTTLKGVFIGRASFRISTVNEILECKTNRATTFTVVSEIDQGVFNSDRANVEKKLGEEAARLFLTLAGKSP